MYGEYAGPVSLTFDHMFYTMYADAAKLTASALHFEYDFIKEQVDNQGERSDPRHAAYEEFLRLYLESNWRRHGRQEKTRRVVASLILACARYEIIRYRQTNAIEDENVRKHWEGLPISYANTLVALGFGLGVYKVEYYQMNFGLNLPDLLPFDFRGVRLSRIREAVAIINEYRFPQKKKKTFKARREIIMRLNRLLDETIHPEPKL